MDIVKQSDNVLILWNKISSHDSLQKFVENLSNKVGSNGKIQVENVERLSMTNYDKSTFNVIISGLIDGDHIEHTSSLLNQYANILKINGRTLLCQKIGIEPYTESDQFISIVKTCGLLIDSQIINNNLLTVHGRKPNFEVGSSVKLSFTCKPDTAAVWKISDTIDEDIETVDPDTLLDDEDLKKPDAASLRVCGTTGLRKACKDCSCGLAEELDAENKDKKASTETTKSSCGNCYLGDAFRCASCPYLGMPAFKPGEKILLSDNQLKADI